MNIDILLVEPKTQGNVGAIARLMKNFNCRNLYVMDPQCDIGERARSRSRKGQEYLQDMNIVSHFPQGYTCIVGTTGVIGGEYNVLRTPVSVKDITSTWIEAQESVLLVFGREDHGLSNEELEMCDVVFHIPASPSYPVLNLSHAVSIVLYELFNAGQQEIEEEFERVDEDTMDALRTLVDDVVDSVGFPEGMDETQRIVLRRVLGKAGLTKREAMAVFGFLRRVNNS